MSKSSRKPRLLHVGRRTRLFDVLDTDLIVLEYLEPISTGELRAVNGINNGTLALERISATKSQEGESGGFHAYSPVHGQMYVCEGVEYVARPVEKYFAYDKDRGFIELTDEQVRTRAQAMMPPPELTVSEAKPLVGDPKDVELATAIRDRLVGQMRSEKREALLAPLLKHTFARWFITRDRIPFADLCLELETFGVGLRKKTAPSSK